MNGPPNHRPEPEIIPPDAPFPSPSGVWPPSGTRRVYTARLGPAGLVLAGLGVGFVGAISLIVALGLAMISLIAAGMLAVVFIVAGFLRKANQPLR